MEKHAIVNVDVLVRWLETIKANLDNPEYMDKIYSASHDLGDLVKHMKKLDAIKAS